MQILINVPDTLPQAVIQQRIKELEESLKKEADQPEKKHLNGREWCKELNHNLLI